jgi:excisionase family DNA binding protein
MKNMINNHESEHGCHKEPRMGNGQESEKSGEPMVKKSEIAEWLGVSQRTVNTYMRERSIPFYKGPRYVLFKISEVEKALLRKIEAEEEEKDGRQRTEEGENRNKDISRDKE